MISTKTVIGASLLLVCFSVAAATLGDISDIFDQICEGNVLCPPCADATGELKFCDRNPYKSQFGAGSLASLFGSLLTGTQLEGFTSLVAVLDHVAKTAATAIKSEGGRVLANPKECGDAVGKILCFFSLELLNCDKTQPNLCKQTCVDFIGKCVVDTAKDAIKELPKKVCKEAGLDASVCDLDISGLLIVNLDTSVCDDLPSSNCDDLGLTEPLAGLKPAERPDGLIWLYILAGVGVVAVIGGALWYRQRAALQVAPPISEKTAQSDRSSAGRRSGGSRNSGRSGARTGSGVSMGSGRMSQASGKTRTKL